MRKVSHLLAQLDVGDVTRAVRWVTVVLACGCLAAPVPTHHNFNDAEDLGRTTDWDAAGREYVGTIGDATDNGYGYEYLKFEVVVGGNVNVWTSGNSPLFAVYDANRVQVRSWSEGAAWQHLEAGTHYIVSASESIGLRYRLHIAGGGKGHDDVGNTLAEAAILSQPGEEPWNAQDTLTRPVTLDYGRDHDWFKFEVPRKGPPVRARIWSQGGAARPAAILFDEFGIELERSNTGCCSTNFYIERTLRPGDYHLVVYDRNNGVGAYRLYLAGRDDHGNYFETARQTQLPTAPSGISGEINYRSDNDVFWFRVAISGNVTVRSSGGADTDVILYDEFEVELTRQTGCCHSDFRVERVLDPGIYYVRVTGDYNGRPYSLHISGDASGVVTVPLMLADGNTRTLEDGSTLRQWSFVRIINHSDQSAEVELAAVDDMGVRHELSSPLTLAARQTTIFNSRELEQGNDEKGIVGGVGDGTGDWYLEIAPSLPEVEVLSYVRTSDGFLSSMHTQVPSYGRTHRVATFNPGSNRDRKSKLRLIHPRCPQFETTICGVANVTIYGVDDKGMRSPDVQLQIASGAAREVTAAELEGREENTEGLVGSLGDGDRKWQLFITADRPIHVMSLLERAAGHLTNLSAPASRHPYSAPERP